MGVGKVWAVGAAILVGIAAGLLVTLPGDDGDNIPLDGPGAVIDADNGREGNDRSTDKNAESSKSGGGTSSGGGTGRGSSPAPSVRARPPGRRPRGLPRRAVAAHACSLGTVTISVSSSAATTMHHIAAVSSPVPRTPGLTRTATPIAKSSVETPTTAMPRAIRRCVRSDHGASATSRMTAMYQLAAMLPSPRSYKPLSDTLYLRERTADILSHMDYAHIP